MDRVDKRIIQESKKPSRYSEEAGKIIERRLKVEKLKNPDKSDFELTQMIIQQLKNENKIR